MKILIVSVMLFLFLSQSGLCQATAQADLVTSMYMGLLNRKNPDIGGWNFWFDQLNNQSADNVISGFVNSQEFMNIEQTVAQTNVYGCSLPLNYDPSNPYSAVAQAT